jgi:hypothetical protein
MTYLHHITSPAKNIEGLTLIDENLNVISVGDTYGRFLFTEWDPIRIAHNYLRRGCITVSRGHNVVVSNNTADWRGTQLDPNPDAIFAIR